MKKLHEIKSNRPFLMLNLILLLVVPIYSSNSHTTYTTNIYFITGDSFKEMKHFDNNNDIKKTFSSNDLDINGNLYKAEIENSFYGDKIELKLQNFGNFYIGFLVEIEGVYFEIQNPELTVTSSIVLNCDASRISIQINGANSKEVKCCRTTFTLSEITFK